MQLADYIDVLRRGWWIVVLSTLVAVATAYAFSRAQAPVYRSSVRLEVTGRIDYGQVLASDRLLRQIAARVKTTTVSEAVEERLKLGLDSGSLLGKLQAQAFPDVLHIQIDVDDDNPERAERIAATTAEVVRDQQTLRMASVPQQERINLAVLDRPSGGRLVWPQTRQIAIAGGVAGALVGGLLAFVLHYIALRRLGPVDAPPLETS